MYRISDIILCICMTKVFDALHTMDISTATIASVFRLSSNKTEKVRAK